MKRVGKIMNEIKEIYDDNCRWLLFAEAKHTILIAVNVAFLSMITEQSIIGKLEKYFEIIALMSILSMAISLISMLPFMNQCGGLNKFVRYINRNKHLRRTIIYYREIYLSDKTYPELLRQFLKKTDFTELENDWVNQIMDIAAVTMIKTWEFKIAGIFLLLGIGFFLVDVIQ